MIAVFAAAAIMGNFESRPFGVYGLPRTAAFRARFWQGATWGIAMITATMLLIRAFRGISFGGLALRGSAVWSYAALWGAAFVCVGLLRGIFLPWLCAIYAHYWDRILAAATILSAVFGATHLANPGEDKVGALSVFVIGMFLCLTLWRTGNLWFAVGLHAAFDWGETFLFSVPDSGFVAPGHLLNSSFHGPAWLTGGTVGPEGSVMAFVVIGIAAVVFVRGLSAQRSEFPSRRHHCFRLVRWFRFRSIAESQNPALTS